MPANKHQHTVSQFAIRHFLGDQGRLFCLDKSTGVVKDRKFGNTPDQILAADYYYTTDGDDFDGEVISPLEKSFAPLCADLVRDHEATFKQDGAWELLVDWSALMMLRSEYCAEVSRIAAETLPRGERSDLPDDPKSVVLTGRRISYERLRREMRECPIGFRFLPAPHPFAYLLTDHPTVVIPFRKVGHIGPSMLPLSHDLIVVQTPLSISDALFHEMGSPSLGWITLMQCGWAGRFIHSADLGTLDFAAEMMRSGGQFVTPQMAELIRRPFMGFTDPDYLLSQWSQPKPSS